MIPALGRSGVPIGRPRTAPGRPRAAATAEPARAERPAPRRALTSAPAAPPARGVGVWLNAVGGLAAGGLVASVFLGGVGHHLDAGAGGFLVLVLAGIIISVLTARRRLFKAGTPAPIEIEAESTTPPPDVSTEENDRAGGSIFARGVHDIRRTDPGFDPARFAGYSGMVFRDAQRAWTTGDLRALHDRVTSDTHDELRMQCARLRSAGRANRVEQIEIHAEIVDAWQHAGQDYVASYIDGSAVDYTVDEATAGLVEGSKTVPRHVAELWTFTRPAGLYPWMLVAIRPAFVAG